MPICKVKGFGSTIRALLGAAMGSSGSLELVWEKPPQAEFLSGLASPSVTPNGSATRSSDQTGTAVTTMLSRKCLVVESNRPPHVTSTSLGGPRRSNTVSGKAVFG